MDAQLQTVSQNKDVATWSANEVMKQVDQIQQLMTAGMKEGEHWGKIPGCGEKPALLKPGAEKLSLMFRLAPKFDIQVIDMEKGHREYRITCSLYHINTNAFWGCGVGSCSTMEVKYRYRGNEAVSTGVPVPKEYWDLKRANKFKEAKELLGGDKYMTKKEEDGRWVICEKGEKTENPDIADTYNTVLKMAKKRAHVDAVLTATAASDIFTQDIEEFAAPIIPTAPNPVATTKVTAPIEEDKNIFTSKFAVSDLITTKKGSNYWKAVDSEGASFAIFDEAIATELKRTEGKDVTVRFEASAKGKRITDIKPMETFN